jgi:hypothetical protein
MHRSGLGHITKRGPARPEEVVDGTLHRAVKGPQVRYGRGRRRSGDLHKLWHPRQEPVMDIRNELTTFAVHQPLMSRRSSSDRVYNRQTYTRNETLNAIQSHIQRSIKETNRKKSQREGKFCIEGRQ